MQLEQNLNRFRQAGNVLRGSPRIDVRNTSNGIGLHFGINPGKHALAPNTSQHTYDNGFSSGFRPEVQAARATGIPIAGNIVHKYYNPGGNTATQIIHQYPHLGLPKAQNSDTHRAINSIVNNHEMSEWGLRLPEVPVKNHENFGHGSPKVILEEGNNLAKLEGPGAKHAIGFFAPLRTIDGSVQQIQKVYPQYVHGQTRVSRHAKARLVDAINRRIES